MGGVGVEPGYDNLKSSVFNCEWKAAGKRAGGGEVKLTGEI